MGDEQQMFWMVLGQGVPTYRHTTRASAVTEAERLSRLHRCEFVVLQSIASVNVKDVEWTRHKPQQSSLDSEVPF